MWVARITVFLYILVFFELGAVLMASPWFTYWSDNLFLTYLVQTFEAPALAQVMGSQMVKWAVTGLGAVNIFLGLWEAFHFKQLVQLMVRSREEPASQAVAVSDHRPKGV
jgi:hypothetical protein